MNRSENIDQLATALAKAQGAMRPAEMGSVNPFLKNRYADLGNIIEAARPALAANGLAITQAPAIGPDGITLETLIMHASGQWLESTLTLPVDDKKGLSTAQAAGSVITYLRRYALAAMLGIYADADEDGNAPQRQAPQRQPAPERTPAQQPPPAAEVDAMPSAGDAPVTENQLKAMFAEARRVYGERGDEFAAWVKDQYHVASRKDLTRRQAEEIITRMRAEQQPA